MYKIPYKMVEIVTDSGEVLSLEDVLKSLSNVPMSLYTGNNDFTKEKIEDVINYLRRMVVVSFLNLSILHIIK